MGKYFKELCLIFGATSSAGIFDPINRIVIFIVLKLSGLDGNLCIQHLDDCCSAAPKDSNILFKFDEIFQSTAEKLGIKLAPRSDKDPDKSFAPCKEGVVLGINYNTVSWTWNLPEEKMARLLHTINDTINAEQITQREMWSLVGKILNIKPLVPGGKFEIDHLLQANNISEDGSTLITISEKLRSQLHFWLKILPLCSNRSAIPDPDCYMPPWTIEVYTDSAGGSYGSKLWHGAGAVTYGWWAFVPWSVKINCGADTGYGKRLDRVMSALELVGPLVTIAAGHEWCRNNPVRVWVDNSASVAIYKKGYSTKCLLSNTLVKAISVVSAGLQCRLEIEKIRRCSLPLAEMADHLSKGSFQKFWKKAAEVKNLNLPLDMAKVPLTIMKWIKDPIVDDRLGFKILEEIAYHAPVLSYNC